MKHFRMKQFMICSLTLIAVFLLGSMGAIAQNFRGGINGVVTDKTGAALANASVVATDVDTGVTHTTVSSSAGEFSIQDLPLGTYTVTVTAAGFSTGKYDKIPLSAGTTYTLPVSLAVSSSAEVVEVNAAGVALDTTSTVLTTDLPSQVVNDAPSNGRDFTQFIQYVPGFAGYSVGCGAGRRRSYQPGELADRWNG